MSARPRHLVRLTTIGVLLGLVLALYAPAVLAADPPEITGPVTDQAGVISPAGEEEATAAIERLQDETRLQLWAVYVDDLGGMPIDDFVDATASRNGLGSSDALLLVAVDDRQYRLNVDDSLLTAEEVEAVAVGATEPALADDDWAGAIVATAEALGEAVGGGGPEPTATPPPTATPRPTDDGSGGGGSDGDDGGGGVLPIIGLIMFGVGFAVVLIVAIRALLGSRLRARTTEERDVQTGDLARKANVLLIQTDDLVRSADTEVAFAEAEFGDDAAPYRTALASAQAEVKAAFAARQQLDDEVPDDAATRRRLLEEIVRRCEAARATLDAQAKAFEELRALERNAPAILAGIPPAIATLESRLAAARTTRAALEAYAESDWASVKGNIPEAEKRIAFARTAVGTAPTAPDAGRTARRAQTALAEAITLLDAIDRLSTALAEARRQVDVELAAADRDIAEAKAAIAAGSVPAGVQGRLAEAESLVAGVRRLLAEPRPGVTAALERARAANAIGDEVLAGIRGERERVTRAAAALEAAIRAAQLSVTRASDFVATRRNGIRQEARTRLSEAERHLAAAIEVGATDPAAGTTEAQKAQRLADEALRIASSDFTTWDSGGIGGGGRRGAEGEIVGAILGGIIGSMIGSGRGGFGGTPWGSSGGGFGGGARRSGGGSLGGMLGGGRRSGGGGFGGGFGGGSRGGRVSGGGRF